VRAEAADLVLKDGSRFTLGEKQALAWVDAILNPKGRMEQDRREVRHARRRHGGEGSGPQRRAHRQGRRFR